MANIEEFIRKFHLIGSKDVVSDQQRNVLRRFVSVDEQVLLVEQQIQIQQNIGLADRYKVGKTNLTKGTHNIIFENPFEAAYMVNATASSATASGAAIIVSDSDLSLFTVKVAFDCTLRWIATVLTE